jgi:hypothetical protein
MVSVLPDDGSGRMRWIDPEEIRYYFSGAAYFGGVMDRRRITESLSNGSGTEMDWRDAPIFLNGIYARGQEAVFRLVKIRSLRQVVERVGGDLLRPHQSVLINKNRIHDYSPKRGEIGFLVNGSDGKSWCERVQVSLRKKPYVDGDLLDMESP